ncbi:uncharacterized protein LOC106667609 [Cimex lectularius]|uniref:Uncharacterized protein n=1 Tax=Cimex lectularius TaxID=79782 RepID=A0A8I6SL77_CIMLE|nr:uncharacterized protein LOC106667609 [Cimex lectularius]
MALPVLKEFLCGMSVRTGALIIGWLCLINSLFTLLPVIIYTGMYLEMSTDQENKLIDWLTNETEQKIYGNESVSPIGHSDNEEFVRNAMEGTVLFLILSGLISVIAATMLICGIHKKNGCLMLPWLVLDAKSCILTFLTFVFWLIIMPFSKVSADGHFLTDLYTKAAITCILFFSVVVPAYAFLVVYTCYRNAKYERSQYDNSFQKL